MYAETVTCIFAIPRYPSPSLFQRVYDEGYYGDNTLNTAAAAAAAAPVEQRGEATSTVRSLFLWAMTAVSEQHVSLDICISTISPPLPLAHGSSALWSKAVATSDPSLTPSLRRDCAPLLCR